MTDDEKQKAREIMLKPAAHWSKEDNSFLWGLMKRGHREALKRLRTEAHLDD